MARDDTGRVQLAGPGGRIPGARARLPACLPAVLLVLVVLVACGVEEPTGTDAYTVSDSAGIRVVESLAPSWASARVVEAEPFLRIGAIEGDEAYQLGYVYDGVILPDGAVVVSDLQAGRLRLFDADGRHLRSFGKPGEGPAEFGRLGPVMEYRGDSVAAVDGGHRRVSVVPASFDGVRSVPNPVEGNYNAFGALADGSFLLFNPGQFDPGLSEGLQWDSTDVVRVEADGGAHEVLGRQPVLQRLIGAEGRRQMLGLAGWSLQAAAPDGFYWGTSDRYELRFHDGEGRLRRILRRPVEPRPLDDEARAEYEAAYVARVARTQGEEAAFRLRRELAEATYAETVPLLQTAFVDRDDRVWVAHSPWPDRQAPATTWAVFSPEGFILGEVGTPAGVRILDARGDVVLGVGTDELDVQYVQLHRMVVDEDGSDED